ncbi:MAG TPA: hypothetical protein VMV18_05305 [bacterium]|nr:hypothetical protein [bacterium]
MMLVISVVTVGVTAAGYTFVPGFREGTNAVADDVKSILASGDIGGVGTNRDPGATANGGVAEGGAGQGSGAGTSNSAAGSNCTGGMIQSCSGQTAGVGGADGHVGTATTGASASAVAVLNDPNASTAEKTAAKAEIVQGATANCSQVFLASVTGQKASTVTVNTVANGLTVPDTMKINIPFFGFHFGNIPTDYKGYMSLDQMQAYLGTQGVQSDVTKNASLSNIQTALGNGQKVGVILDVDQNGNPTTGCSGKCGHTVKVTSVTAQGVRIKDKYGERTISADQFNAAWSAQGSGMLAVTPKGKQQAWAWR